MATKHKGIRHPGGSNRRLECFSGYAPFSAVAAEIASLKTVAQSPSMAADDKAAVTNAASNIEAIVANMKSATAAAVAALPVGGTGATGAAGFGAGATGATAPAAGQTGPTGA